ncbi:phage holin family protein [Acinetobacter larvae]|uniref:Holin n=1 Tax=Acinetobacter larvae TaxID=1789224 RepID=A0A1B2LZY0_9GAMM|nr:holin [Acinetobacter larvae]AOA58343.1 hypothetical protein BFG52_08230 [Acinetobacter larvae]
MSENSSVVVDTASAAVTSLSSKTAMVGGSVGFVAWFASLDWIAIVSICVAVIGGVISVCNFFVNLKYQRQKNKREQEIHELTKRKLEEDCDVK